MRVEFVRAGIGSALCSDVARGDKIEYSESHR
jgi:hypothetical protein